MKKPYILMLLFTITSIISTAQNPPTIQWQKSFGGSTEDAAYSIQQTSDGGYIVAGYSTSTDGDVAANFGSYDYWIVKLNASGFIQWQQSFGGSDADEAYSIKQTADGGYVVAGSTESNHFIGGNRGESDDWIIKLDANGLAQWKTILGGSYIESASSVEQTTDGGYIVAGISKSNNGDVRGHHGDNNSFDYWIVKLDGSGILQWQQSLGGSKEDYAQAIVETSDKGYIIAGYSNSNDGDVSGNHGGSDYWIVKLNPDALLPVTLINFSGSISGKVNELSWTTATEINNTGFELQRSSDGINFDKISFINTKAVNGNNNSQLTYNFSDASYTANINYYRLKQIDKDGRFTYSNIVALEDANTLASGAAIVFPNPVKSLLNIKINSLINDKATFQITDLNGRFLSSKVASLSQGENVVQLGISHLPSGTYLVKINCTSGRQKIMKFVKE